MNSFSVVEILQISFAGIAFLLAFLAYRLLIQESMQERPRQSILKSIQTYMLFAFSMGSLAIGAQFASSYISPPSPKDNVTRINSLEKKLRALADTTDDKFIKVSNRIGGIQLIAKEVNPSPAYGCGAEQKAEPNTLTVMFGLRDGTSCKVPNTNYYKELSLIVPN